MPAMRRLLLEDGVEGLVQARTWEGDCTIPKPGAHGAPSLPEKYTGRAVGVGGTDSGHVWIF